MKIALWTVQIMLAGAFLMAGSMKAMTPYHELAAQMPWVSAVPTWLPALIGVAEVLGGVGLILPAATRVKPWLTPLAAAGLATVMVLAGGLHAIRGEFGMLPINFILMALSLFVVWGRTKKVPIAERKVARLAQPSAA